MCIKGGDDLEIIVQVAGDDRCKILISSLQDTLHGIENKSYGAR